MPNNKLAIERIKLAAAKRLEKACEAVARGQQRLNKFRYALDRATLVMEGSDGDATKSLYADLTALGVRGAICVNLFRANKNSARAKKYHGGDAKGSFRDQAYERKQWAMNNLTQILMDHCVAEGINWGWKVDENGHRSDRFKNVLYVEIPTGQLSFHSDNGGLLPKYDGVWDQTRGESPHRICCWAAMLLAGVNDKEFKHDGSKPVRAVGVGDEARSQERGNAGTQDELPWSGGDPARQAQGSAGGTCGDLFDRQ